MGIEPILITTVQVQTFKGVQALTNATGFFFERGLKLYIVTCRHVVFDSLSDHHPDRIEIGFHIGEECLSQSSNYPIELYENGFGLWKSCSDSAGDVDIAAIEISRQCLPSGIVYKAFSSENLLQPLDSIEVGDSIVVVGYPLGFQDHLHHLPVVRQATIASSFGLRFQGQGYFLTDARTHRGTSGAPVVARTKRLQSANLPWLLLGIHSSRMDVGIRDRTLDEALGLNCVWYADALMTLTGY